ncbi:C40 family peptidase [Pseudomonas typographi]|uniref:C40 family peptidase n=1 Tax=Pseudomonas typographi TaxID=2715964 RepID=A0ABR7YZL2_9PSED|nr:C40 family peptidase [Pseudomonas typographi]MBD1549936.1 C40 family peptidase [Pseudomonas typographi]MBD1585317.1 C40 family peptidase [Pseudomonas typographi]MBD1598569.1 C40 family peptidase [Pseudomonas typographi]
MRPITKTWLTLCLLLPLAAHATTREQRLPSGFSGQTARTESAQANPQSHTPSNARQQTTVATLEPRKKRSGRTVDHSKRGKGGSIEPALAQATTKQSSIVVARAVNALGTPYRWGGTSPSKGFDCSGLVKYAFNDVNSVNLPRTSRDMAAGHGVKVERSDLKPGDLLFFNTRGRQVNHVAIYLGDDRFIHAPSRGKAVTIDTLDKPYWNERYVVAKRVLKPQQQPIRLASVGDEQHTRTR